MRYATFTLMIMLIGCSASAQEPERFYTPGNRADPRGVRLAPLAEDALPSLTGVWRVDGGACALIFAPPDVDSGGVSSTGCGEPWSRVRAWRAPPTRAGRVSLQLHDAEGVRVWAGLRRADGSFTGRAAGVRFTLTQAPTIDPAPPAP